MDRASGQLSGQMDWMAPPGTGAHTGVAAESLARGLIHRFSADGAGPPAGAAMELLRPASAEPDQPGSGLAEAAGTQATPAPSLELIQPMREVQPAPPLQRALGTDGEASGDSAAAADIPDVDIEALARQVYDRLRRRLRIDEERLGH
jgi:hypothetical protein